jgi:demethylmenaquinone methyltransferase / 2-methoxy-6-polyprenyl-1,4-benzoquinol methylase|tara:strand:- start:883 stop:1587 length:705 start_codon:yes stop_codon:yes gene_type:complete
MKTNIQDKTSIVNSVFSRVHKKYDLMNDIMSFGIHRIWKNKLIEWMNPQNNESLIDVAAGTGDIAKLFSKKNNHNAQISCVEPNTEMFNFGRNNLNNLKNIKWHKNYAEKLPFKDNTFDFYSISYGIRNVSNINLSLKEALRVLKPGGRFMCLEFSKIDNEILNLLYQQYSKAIPFVGKYIVGSSKPYDYLIKSINKFYTQEELVSLMQNNGFSNIEYRNLSSGISAIHSGWKI